jgi:predicted dehydrogenase
MRYGDGEKLIVGKCTKDPDKPKERTIICNAVADDSLALELKEFISAVRNGTPTNPTPLDAHETLKIVERIYKTNKI